jgi:hypothetical protein
MTAEKISPTRPVGAMRALVAAVLFAGLVVTGMAMPNDLPPASAKPPTMPTDSQGYVNSPARCGPNQSAVVVGRTALSLVAICADGRGGYEYHGMRLSDGAVLVLPAKALSGGCFGARTDTIDFTISERKLLLVSGLRIVRDETMVEFRDYRTASADAAAPLTQQAGNQRSR